MGHWVTVCTTFVDGGGGGGGGEGEFDRPRKFRVSDKFFLPPDTAFRNFPQILLLCDAFPKEICNLSYEMHFKASG